MGKYITLFGKMSLRRRAAVATAAAVCAALFCWLAVSWNTYLNALALTMEMGFMALAVAQYNAGAAEASAGKEAL